MKKGGKSVLIVLAVLLALEGVLQIVVFAAERQRAKAPGNASQYDVHNLAPHADSPLAGKTILFLGSSVTEGAAAKGQSFVELFAALDGVNAFKEAKSGTTLADSVSMLALLAFGNGQSYVQRIQNVDPSATIDCVVCQLSTNDASLNRPLGEIAEGREFSDFDSKTVTGAMERIIRYSQQTWGCPVVFYTGSYYKSDAYTAMVQRLFDLQDKWDIGVIDLYTDETFNAIDRETYDFYMYDEIHPTEAGYLEWWFPKMESDLITILTEKE